MIKFWEPVFSDLKPYDSISFDEALERYRDALCFVNKEEYYRQLESGRAHIGIKSSDLSDPEVAYFHNKFNHPSVKIPTSTQIVIRHFRPEYAKKEYHLDSNKHIFEGLTTNYNGRDGHIVSSLSTKWIESLYLIPKRAGKITGNWLYLTIPGELVYKYLRKSVNSAPLDTAINFIETVDNTIGWDDEKGIKLLVDEYCAREPNWNHDFPIKGFQQIKKDGVLNPIFLNSPWVTCSEGTHRLVMTGFNKLDTPFFIPVPEVLPEKWNAITREKMFFHEGEYKYLNMEIDTLAKKSTFSFSTDPHVHVKRNNLLQPRFMSIFKGTAKKEHVNELLFPCKKKK